MKPKSYVTKITIISEDYNEVGSGIVLQIRPLTILVPAHVSVAIEDGSAHTVLIEGVEYNEFEIRTTSFLERDHLAIIQFRERAPKSLRTASLPRRPPLIAEGMPVSCLRRTDGAAALLDRGAVKNIICKGSDKSFLIDIPISPGDSGSPKLSDNRLIGICVGINNRGSGHTIVIPFSQDVLKELRRIALRTRRTSICTAAAILLLAVGSLAIRSWTTFDVAGVEGPMNTVANVESPNTLTASNGQLLTLRPTWKRTFPTSIRWWVPLSMASDDNLIDRIAIGTVAEEGTPGSLFLLSNLGRTLWSHTVPDGECVYSNDEETFDGFKVYRVFVGDLTGNGQPEILASFTHAFWYPCNVVLFDLSGRLLGKYWHPGYLRTFAIGPVGERTSPMLIMTGSNNRFRPEDSPWNPQGLMAFSGADLIGQAPPYTGSGLEGNELWYYLLPNVDDEHKSKFDSIVIADSDGDGKSEILAHTSDDRFYYLDEHGEVLRVELGDEYLKEFGNIAAPELQRIDLDPAQYEDWPL